MSSILANVIIDYAIKGGPIMVPILLALIAALVVIAERSLWWWSLAAGEKAPLLLPQIYAESLLFIPRLLPPGGSGGR